jgi:hypothetical protein
MKIVIIVYEFVSSQLPKICLFEFKFQKEIFVAEYLVLSIDNKYGKNIPYINSKTRSSKEI